MRQAVCVGMAWLVAMGICGVVRAEEKAANTAVQPVPRGDNEGWMNRYRELSERAKQGPADLVFIGDSITQGWEGDGKEVWAKYYGHRHALNIGISGDQTQHVLWRLDHGNIDGQSPKLAVLMIGTNNQGVNTPEQIGEGITAIVKKLREKLPNTKILILAIFPRGPKPDDVRAGLAKASEIASKAADNKTVFYLDINGKFLGPDGTLSPEVMPDYLHPNAKGYQIWAQAIEGKVAELLGDKKVE